MRDRLLSSPSSGSSRLVLLVCGVLGLLGPSAAVVADVVGFLVVDAHDPISETISKLAVGDRSWIQDVGISIFGLGAASCGVGLAAWRRGGLAWKAGVTAIFLLAVDLACIAQYDRYEGQLGEGATVHRALVYALYGIFAASSLLLARGLGDGRRGWRNGSVASGLAWIVLAPLLFVVPTAWDGAYERVVACILVGWFLAVSILLIRTRDGASE